MRRCILALLIALLPLRAWLGDAMAVESGLMGFSALAAESMEPHAEQAFEDSTQLARQTAHEHRSVQYIDHGQAHAHTHSSAQAPSQESAPAQGSAHETRSHGPDTCTACQICHLMALTAPLLVCVSLLAQTSRPWGLQRLHLNAVRVPADKPPIS